MKRLMLCMIALAVTVAFTGCQKKEPTAAESLNNLTTQADKAAKDAGQTVDKAAADLQKTGENVTK